jgi:hypothetical protein
MLKASALYIVIIITLVIGVLCSSLIVAGYFYNIQYKKKVRYDRLANNLNSGINILLAVGDSAYTTEKKTSLFNTDQDSVSLKSLPWGVYDIGIAKSIIQKDTLYKTFSIANAVDSSKWTALYLIDEDRPFSLSGKTTIRGDAYIPKAGVQEAYIDNKAYQGDKRLIIGKRHNSEKTLPVLDQSRLSALNQYFVNEPTGEKALPGIDSIRQSFLLPTSIFNFKKKAQTLQNIALSGNIVLFSDTTITIDNTTKLTNVLVFARAIVVKSGFNGNCQLFATDSISVENNCNFIYPSCLGVLRFQSSTISSQVKITINEGTTITGIVFTYEKADKPVKPIIVIGQNTKISGQVYSQGILQLKEQTEMDGSVFTSRFLYKNSFTLFENYLVNATIDSKALSPYYLTSGLMPVAGKKKKVLQWLESN